MYGLERMLIHSSKNMVSLSTGVVTNYALYILIGLCSYTLILLLNIDSNVNFMSNNLIGIGAIIFLIILMFIPSIINILVGINENIIIDIIVDNTSISKSSRSIQLLESKIFTLNFFE